MIDSGPSGTTNDSTPTFEFHSTEAGSSFDCSIDTGTAAFGALLGPGRRPHPEPALADGTYTFRVRATDGAANPTDPRDPQLHGQHRRRPRPDPHSTVPASPANQNSPKVARQRRRRLPGLDLHRPRLHRHPARHRQRRRTGSRDHGRRRRQLDHRPPRHRDRLRQHLLLLGAAHLRRGLGRAADADRRPPSRRSAPALDPASNSPAKTPEARASLRSNAASTRPKPRAWASCTSPKAYTGLADGRPHASKCGRSTRAGQHRPDPRPVRLAPSTPPRPTRSSTPAPAARPTTRPRPSTSTRPRPARASNARSTPAPPPSAPARARAPPTRRPRPLADGDLHLPGAGHRRRRQRRPDRRPAASRSTPRDSPAPTLSSTVPASPANQNSPKVLGSAAAGSQVSIYSTSGCTGTPLATGTAAELGAGITVAVADNSTTAFRATATASGNTSSCSAPLTYVEDSAAPQTLIGTHPPALSASASASFEFSGEDPGGSGVASLQCRLDSTEASAWARLHLAQDLQRPRRRRPPLRSAGDRPSRQHRRLAGRLRMADRHDAPDGGDRRRPDRARPTTRPRPSNSTRPSPARPSPARSTPAPRASAPARAPAPPTPRRPRSPTAPTPSASARPTRPGTRARRRPSSFTVAAGTPRRGPDRR